MHSQKADKAEGVKYDQIGKLTGFCVIKNYPDKLRRVKFYDEETGRTFVFLTNNIDSQQNKYLYFTKTVGKLNYSLNG